MNGQKYFHYCLLFFAYSVLFSLDLAIREYDKRHMRVDVLLCTAFVGMVCIELLIKTEHDHLNSLKLKNYCNSVNTG